MEEETYERRDNHTPGHSAVLSHHEKYVILMTLCAGGIAAIFVSMIAMTMAIKFKLHKYFVHRLAIYQVLSAMFYSSLCVVEMIFILTTTKILLFIILFASLKPLYLSMQSGLNYYLHFA